MRKLKPILVLATAAMILALMAFPSVASAAPADGTGLTAAVVAVSGQTVSGTVNATGYDVGVYVGPGVHNVRIVGATVSGANDEGILVQDASDVVIRNSTISGNGVSPTPGVLENKAIMLVGATRCVVEDNKIENNMADGGIGIEDDSPTLDPGAPIPTAKAPTAGTRNVVVDNLVKDNAFGCGIVVTGKNAGAGVHDNVVSDNTVVGGWSGAPGASIPYVGGIVVATGTFAPSSVTNTVIRDNEVTNSLIPGIILRCLGNGTISGTLIVDNELSNNGPSLDPRMPGDPNDSASPTGIAIVAENGILPGTPVVSNTQVVSDEVSNDYYGVWVCNATATHIADLDTSSVTVPVHTCP